MCQGLNASFPSSIMTSPFISRWVGLIGLALTGCSHHSAPVDPVSIDADEVSQTLIDEHDQDGSGGLSSDELHAITGMQSCMKKYDVDGDGQLVAEELSENLSRIFDGRIGMLSATCRVTHNGRPLAGAIVYFVPLPMFADQAEVAGGITGPSGVAELSIRQEDLPKNAPNVRGLIRPGLYFVEVTHPTTKVPEQYNVKTTLGYEVTPQSVIGGPIDVSLKF